MALACPGSADGARLFQKLVGLLQVLRVEARRDLAVGRAGAVDLFHEFAGRVLHQPRVERVLFLEALQVGHAHAVVEVVGAGLQDVAIALRALGGDHGFEGGIEQRGLEALQFGLESAGCLPL